MLAQSTLSVPKRTSSSRSKTTAQNADTNKTAALQKSFGPAPSPSSNLPITTSSSVGNKPILSENPGFNKCIIPKAQSIEWSNAGMMSSVLDSGLTLNASQDAYNCEDKDLTNTDPTLTKNTGDAVTKFARLLSSKKKKFLKIKRDLVLQQKIVLETFANIKDMEKKAKIIGAALGNDDIILDDMKIVDMGSWGGFDIRLIIRDKLSPENFALDSILGASVLREVVMRLSSVPEDVSALSVQFLIQLRSQIEYITNRCKIDKIWQGDGIKKRISELNTEIDKLEAKSESTVAAIRVKLEHVVDMTKISWTDRDLLIKRVERAKRELYEAQRKLEEAAGDSIPMTSIRNVDNSAIENELRAQLARERSTRETIKSTALGTEASLRLARTRISELEKQLKEALYELDHAHNKLKEIDQQSKHRQSCLEVCSKKIKEVSKTGEATIETLTKQRDAFELRVKELSDQLALTEARTERRLKEEQARYAALETQSAEQQRAINDAENRVRATQEKCREAERAWAQLQERCNSLLIIHEQRRADFIPQSQGGSVTDQEVELWKDLQSSRLALGKAREETRKARLDKELFLQQLSKIAQKEDSDIQGRIAEEFIEKERTNCMLQDKVSSLEQKEKALEQKIANYEAQIANLKLQVKKLENYTCNTNPRSNEDLHTQVMELQIEVSRSHAERTVLERAAVESRLLLERHERAAALQRRAVRLREELLLIMQRSGDLPSCTALRAQQVASATTIVRESDAEQTWSVLQNEHARVMRLEQLVSRQHEQLRRCNSERCRLEQSRSRLERKLNQHMLDHSCTSLEPSSTSLDTSRTSIERHANQRHSSRPNQFFGEIHREHKLGEIKQRKQSRLINITLLQN